MIPAYDIGVAAVVFSVVGLGLLGAVLLLSWMVRPLRERPRAQETYECGFPAKGSARSIGFTYISYAALFLIFDLAALYLFLYAVLPKPSLGVTISIVFSLLTLCMLILYGTKKRKYYVA